MVPVEKVLAKLPDAKKSDSGWSARCPAHEDRNASLSIGEGEDGRALVYCHAGCSTEAVCDAINLQMADLMAKKGASPTPVKLACNDQPKKGKRRTVAKYDYCDENGALLFQVVRFEPKDFRQRQPNADGSWDWSVKGVRIVPYRLPRILANPDWAVIVVEGEKDVDALARIGLLATCNAGGAGKWTPDHAEFLRGRRVAVLPDNDEAGRRHAEQVVATLQGMAKQAFVVNLPGLPPKGDVSDWLAGGGSREKLIELLKAASSSAAGGAGGPASGEPKPAEYVPFPIDLLPSPASEFVEASAEALGCDPAYVALPLLTSLASAIGNVRRIELKKSWYEPCVLWTVIIGESGTLKSPALDLALESVRQKQSVEYREYADAMHEHEQWSQCYDVDLADWKKRGRKAAVPPPEKPEPPIWQQRLAEDTTVEALAVLLENQPRGLLVARDELSGWLNSFDAYKSARGADVAHWLSMHRAGSLLVNRKSGRTVIRVPRAAVSICGGIQPVTLASALAGRYSAEGPEKMDKPSSEHFENGLAARLLLAHPPRLPKRWSEADIGDDVRAAMRQRFEELFSLDAPVDENGELAPIDLPLTADAKKRFIAFYNEHAREQCELNEDLAAAWSKGEGYAARLALLCELVANPNSTAITDASMERGILLARWFVDEAARIYADLGGESDDPEARDKRELKRLAEWVRSHGGRVSVRDLTRGPRQYRGNADLAEKDLGRLVDAGFGEWESSPISEAGGRPTRFFALASTGDGDESPQTGENPDVSSPSPVSPSANAPDRVGVTI